MKLTLMLRIMTLSLTFAAVLAPFAGEEDDVVSVPHGVGVVRGVLGVEGVGRGGGVWEVSLGLLAHSVQGGNFEEKSRKW